MGLRTATTYRESLRDGRHLIYRGQAVADLTEHPSLSRTIDHAAALFDHPSDGPDGFWSAWDAELGEVSTYFLRPTEPSGLRHRGDLIEETTRRARSTLNIIKAVGTDALLALEHVTPRVDAEFGTDYARRVGDFREHCAREDLAMALAATDAKGDRSLAPSAQADPDLHLRVVRRDADGIVVRGAKLHTTAAPSANELICIPCRAMGEADTDYAVAFAVPLNAPGLTMISHPLADGPAAEHPVSSRNIEVETLTVFDDVHVPWERVFLCGESAYAGAVATAFANYHRYTAISYKPPFVDLLIGAAAMASDQLGIAKSAATRDKLARLIVYGELIRAARLAAAERCRIDELTGLAIPDPVATNAGKYHFATGFHAAVALLQDLAGGLVVTAPGIEDLEHPELGACVDKYLAGRAGVSGVERWKLVQLIRDLTASEFGGYNYVVTLHGEGSPGAQLLQSVRTYDLDRCVGEVRGILDDATVPAPSVV
jgi:4-hydroxybutyryl-CoA dehydratase / vinylacetyl-CoA-Delta-isomerase